MKNKLSELNHKNRPAGLINTVVLILVIIIVLTIGSVDLAATTDDEYFAGNQLKQLGILKGYPDGTLKLENTITRSEVATIMVRIRGAEDEILEIEGRDFTDINSSHWAYDYVQNAYKLNIIQGYPDYSFKPENNISYAEVVAIMVNTLGYKEEIEGDWPYNYINKGKELGVIPSNSDVDPNKIVTRGEMALIVWDTLLVKLEDTSILQ